MLGAFGLAVGAALGGALPPSETEDRLMGKTGDRLQRRAAEAGREGSWRRPARRQALLLTRRVRKPSSRD